MLRVLHNTTLVTAAKLQAVLEAADAPLSRYEIFHRLGGSVNYPIVDSVLDYFAQLGLVADEGKGGKAGWRGPVTPRQGKTHRRPRALRPARRVAGAALAAGAPFSGILAGMPPSEVPHDNLDRLLKTPTRTSFRMWQARTPEERLRASLALTAFASRLREGTLHGSRA